MLVYCWCRLEVSDLRNIPWLKHYIFGVWICEHHNLITFANQHWKINAFMKFSAFQKTSRLVVSNLFKVMILILRLFSEVFELPGWAASSQCYLATVLSSIWCEKVSREEASHAESVSVRLRLSESNTSFEDLRSLNGVWEARRDRDIAIEFECPNREDQGVDSATLEPETGGGKSLRVKHILFATSG